jgi:hypothetical protein
LIKRLAEMARDKGLELVLVREGGNHTVYRIGTFTFPIPRHREINELTASSILKRAEEEQA